MKNPPEFSKRYPLSENDPDSVFTATGKSLSEINVEAVLSGKIDQRDMAIAPDTLRAQAEIARLACKDRLADNLERAAEMATISEDVLLSVYELLRPGRAAEPDLLRQAAADLRNRHSAIRTAAMLDEAADVYTRRGLFVRRF